MKLIKVLLVIFIVSAVSLVGLDLVKKTGKIVGGFDTQTGSNTSELREFNFRSLEHNGKQDAEWKVNQLLFKVDLHKKYKDFINVKFEAVEGYELVAYDIDGNKLGIINYITVSDDKSENGFEADFDLDNFLYKNYFKVVAEKIGK